MEFALTATAQWWEDEHRQTLCSLQANNLNGTISGALLELHTFAPFLAAWRMLHCPSASAPCRQQYTQLETRAQASFAQSALIADRACTAALFVQNGSSVSDTARAFGQRNASCAMFALEELAFDLLAERSASSCTGRYVLHLLAAAFTPTTPQLRQLWEGHRAGNGSAEVAPHLPQAVAHHALMSSTAVPWPHFATMLQAQQEIVFLQLFPHCDSRSRLHLRAIANLGNAHSECKPIAQAVVQSGYDFFVSSATCTKQVCKRALETFVMAAARQPMCLADVRVFAEMDSICHTAGDFKPCLYSLAGLDTFTSLKEEFTTQLWTMGPYTTHRGAPMAQLTTVIGQHGRMESILDLSCSADCYNQQVRYLHSLQPLSPAYKHAARSAHGLCARSVFFRNNYCLVEERIFASMPMPRHLLYKAVNGRWEPAPFLNGQASAHVAAELLAMTGPTAPVQPLQLNSNPELTLYELFGFMLDAGSTQYTCSSCGRFRASSLLAAHDATHIFNLHQADRIASVAVKRASLLSSLAAHEAVLGTVGNRVDSSAAATGRVSAGFEATALSVLQSLQTAAFIASRQLWGRSMVMALSLLDDVLCSSGGDGSGISPACTALLRQVLHAQLLEVMATQGINPPRACNPYNFMVCSGLKDLIAVDATGSAPLCSACGLHLARWTASAHMVLLRESTDRTLITITHQVCLAFGAVPWDTLPLGNKTWQAVQVMEQFCLRRQELVVQANRHQLQPTEFAQQIAAHVRSACSEIADSVDAPAISPSSAMPEPTDASVSSNLFGLKCSVLLSFTGVELSSLPSEAFLRELEASVTQDFLSLSAFDESHVQLRFTNPKQPRFPPSATGSSDVQSTYDVEVFLHATSPGACSARQAFAQEAVNGWRLHLPAALQVAQQWQAQGWWTRKMGNGSFALSVRGPPSTPPQGGADGNMGTVALIVGLTGGAILAVAAGIALRAWVRKVNIRRVYAQ